MNNNFLTYRLLYIIKKKLSVDYLLDLGFDYSQIILSIQQLFEQKMISDEGEKGIFLTSFGEYILEKYSTKYISRSNSEWILPDDKQRITKFDKFDVYLPSRKK